VLDYVIYTYMKYLFSTITVLLLSIAFSYGQKVTYDGKLTDMDTEKNLTGVTVRVLNNGAEVANITTSSNGNYSVQFPPGKEYVIEFSKPGYVTKIVKVDVILVNEEDMPPGGKIFPPVPLELFMDREGANFDFLKKEAVVEWYFDRDRMTFDSGKANRTKKKIADKLQEAEESAGQNEAKYNALIQEADKLYNDKTYQQALDKYVLALQIPGKQTEKHPNNRLIELEALLQKKAEEDLAFKQENQAYLNVIEAADNFAKNKDYDKAIAKYNEAIAMKSDEQYPKDKITELKEEKENAAKREEYDKVLKQADGFFKQNSLQAARDKYQAASKLLPKEQYPKDQLAEIAGKLDAQSAEREKKEKYNQAIADADALFNKEDYSGSIDKYKEAITFESAATYPVERIAMAESKLAEQKAANENLETFNQLVAEGDEAVKAKRFQDAVGKYDEALSLIADEAVTLKRDNAKKELEQLKEQEELESQITNLLASAENNVSNKKFIEAIEDFESVLVLDAKNAKAIAGKSNAEKLLAEKEASANQKELDDKIAALLTSAEKKLGNNEYTAAIEDFQVVLTLNPQNPKAIEGKATAERLLAEKQQNEASEEEFNQLVTNADKDFNDQKWEEAKIKYLAAKAIFDNKKHVNDRLQEIRTKLEKENDQKRIAEEVQVLLDQATSLKAKNDWGSAILKYEEALKLDNQRNDIKDLLNAAKKSQEEWDAQQSQEEQFAQLKEEGNLFLAQKNWADAKIKYEAALKINSDSEIDANLEIIKQKIAEEALSQKNQKEFEAKLKSAEELASAEEYKQALVVFNEALELKKNDPVVKSRIADMQQKIDNQKSKAEKNERYNIAIKEGRKALENKDYAAAIKSFDDALIEKPLDSEATQLKNTAKELIKGLQSEEEQYNGLVASGQSKYDVALSNNNDVPTLKEAKALFVEAQGMRPKASLPQNKIVEIDELMRQIEEAKQQEGEQAEINRRYEEQLDLASVAAQDNKYENAISYLREAAKIKPQEEFPQKKIDEYLALIDEISSKKGIDKKYNEFINKADLAFDNKSFEESIGIYKEALKVKENEAYPKAQIIKAEKSIVDIAKNAVNKEYQNYIDKADTYFANKDYEDALGAYKSALGVQLNDTYAKDKIDETQQILNNQIKKGKEEAEKLAKFNERILAADELFQKESFLAAKTEYENALKIYPNDSYANDQVQLSIANSKKKTDAGDDLRYQKILTKADEYFDDENYDKAIGLYERAIKLRSNDQYPVDKIAEITAIKNGNVKTESNVEYLGEQSNISIMEGAALLEQGERQREQLKQQSVENQLRKNEGLEQDRSNKDFDERIAYENEITSLKDRRDQMSIDEGDKLKVFIENVDNIQYDMELRSIQNDNFERGEVLRTNQNLVYITDEMDATKDRFTEDHSLIIEQVKQIEEARNDQSIAEAAHHNVKVVGTEEELLKVNKQYEQFILDSEISRKDNEVKVDEIIIKRDEQSNAEIAKHKVRVNATGDDLLKVEKQLETFIAMSEENRKDNEVKVDDIIKGREVRTFEEQNSSYKQVMKLQDDALLAEIKVSESKEDKHAVNEQLQDDIYALDAALQRKFNQETVQAYQDQLLIDSQYAAADDQYAKSQEGKDDARQLALEVLKEMDQKDVEQSTMRSEKQYAESQNTQKEVETVNKMQEEQGIQQKQDLALINEKLKTQENAFERADNMRSEEEKIQRHNTINELERIKKQEELTKEGKEESIKENYENVKGLDEGIEVKNQMREESFKKDKFKTQELVNQLENNKLTFNEGIANTLGDEYPEGVSQENYIRKDKDGIPVKIVTRRFVIENGRGDVYIRIQSRNGLTYSKNGMPVTEQSWINGTENAKLEKHY